jgi:polar amino acid transport system substrate-binding protein
MKGKWFILFSVLVLSAIVLSACGAQPATETPGYPAEGQPPAGETAPTGYPAAETEVVQVATDATWPPFELVDEATKELVGFDIDLMNAIAEKAGFQVEFINTPFDPLLAGVSTCQYDAAISAISITDDRKESMLFSDPYMNAGQIVVVQTSNTDIGGKDDLVGKIIGAQLGTTGEREAQAIADATVKPYDSIVLAFLDLQNGQLDAVIADYPTAFGFIQKSSDTIKLVGEVFTDENYGIAVCKDNPELVNKINTALTALKDEGKLAELEVKWLSGE